jgi:hypothetical protein
MRQLEEVPHHTFKITIHSYNSRFIVKIELGQFEQSFKINESDVSGLSDVKKMLSEEFYGNCMKRFLVMREDWEYAFKNLNK